MESIILDDKIPFILIVDDVQKNLQVIGTILETEGYEIAVAGNGFEALEIVKNDIPDLILLDITMPDMDGYEVCKRLKSDPATKNVPIVFLTARTETEDIVKGFEIGGVDYVTKPFKKEELLSRIHTHIELTFSKLKLKQINDELVMLNAQKNEFLSIAAHDMKNPLSVIKGLADFLIIYKDEIDMAEILDIANQIKTSSDFMFKLIVDLLDINAIEQGVIDVNFEVLDIDSILAQIVKRFEYNAEKKNIEIICNNNCKNVQIYLDKHRLQQILDNLVSNALKFSPLGKRIWINSDFSPDGNIILEIKDEGPGISEIDKRKLFTKFAKLSARPTGHENSTGLGLSIVKKLAEIMKCEIWCESELSIGTSFKLKIPIATKENI